MSKDLFFLYFLQMDVKRNSAGTSFDHCLNPFSQTGIYTVKTSLPLGKLLLVKLEKDPFLVFPEDEWYCSKVVVTTPEGEVVLFPCYRWISRGELVELRGGRGLPQNTSMIRKLMDTTGYHHS